MSKNIVLPVLFIAGSSLFFSSLHAMDKEKPPQLPQDIMNEIRGHAANLGLEEAYTVIKLPTVDAIAKALSDQQYSIMGPTGEEFRVYDRNGHMFLLERKDLVVTIQSATLGNEKRTLSILVDITYVNDEGVTKKSVMRLVRELGTDQCFFNGEINGSTFDGMNNETITFVNPEQIMLVCPKGGERQMTSKKLKLFEEAVK